MLHRYYIDITLILSLNIKPISILTSYFSPSSKLQWKLSSHPCTFLSTLNSFKNNSNIFTNLPTVLLTNNFQLLNDQCFPDLKIQRKLEVDAWTGQNCHLALFSLIYWIIKFNKQK